MRLVTRSDFDGLACAVLLNALGMIDDYQFVHPKDLQDGKVEVSENDILANVPYVPGCGIWFDHHSSENERIGNAEFKGAARLSPSCARVIWEYYGGHAKFSPDLDVMMAAVDRVDSGQLTKEDVLDAKGWILLGFIMDPRTGLGRYKDYRISNYQLMLDMIKYCGTMTAEQILEQPDVKERTDRYYKQQEEFTAMLKRRGVMHGNCLELDLREEEEIFSGNRFSAYALFPDSNVSIQIIWGLRKQNVVFTVGHSILNRTCRVNIGSLMLHYGGGGHMRVGTCQVPEDKAAEVRQELLDALK